MGLPYPSETIMKLFSYLLASLLSMSVSSSLFASNSLRLQEVATNVYALVGELGNRTPENLGNNATFGAIVTEAGVVLIDSGGTYQGAAEIHRTIKTVTNQPVVAVINTGGQDHRWMGNSYFKERGATIIASSAAVEDQQTRASEQLSMLNALVGEEALSGTEPIYADNIFTERYEFSVGGIEVELVHPGPAHTPGDSFVWLPGESVLFAGDIVYTERMLGIGPQSDSKGWIDAFRSISAYQPTHLVPGHGSATDLATSEADTYSYLLFLRSAVSAFIEDGGDIIDIGSIDQSRYGYLSNFESLAGRNAQKVYTELEWE